MAQEKLLSGCAAAAQAAKLAEVEVICSYPIRPYTAIMMELAKMVANGELDAEFVHGEGEHGQLSVVLGASAAGARAYTGSAGVNAVELSIEHLLGFFTSPFAETPLSNSWLRGSRNFRTIIFDTVDLLQDVLKDCDGSFGVSRGKHCSF
jgi:hypothetical protein